MVDINGIFAKTGIVKGRPWHTFFFYPSYKLCLEVYLSQSKNQYRFKFTFSYFNTE